MRSSFLVQAEATTDEFPLVKLELATIPSGSETLSLRFTGYTDEGFALHTVPFYRPSVVGKLDSDVSSAADPPGRRAHLRRSFDTCGPLPRGV